MAFGRKPKPGQKLTPKQYDRQVKKSTTRGKTRYQVQGRDTGYSVWDREAGDYARVQGQIQWSSRKAAEVARKWLIKHKP